MDANQIDLRRAKLINPVWDKDVPCIPTRVMTPSGPHKISIREAEERLAEVRQHCIMESPSFAPVISSVRHIILTPGHPYFETVAFTDGTSVYYGKGYFMEAIRAQAAVNVHEVLHVGLQHCQRGMRIYKDTGGREGAGKEYDPYVWNLAVDAVVNLSTFSLPWVSAPSCGVVKFADLIDEETLKSWPPHTWSAESLYFRLMKTIKSQSKLGVSLKEMVDKIKKAMDDIRNGNASADSFKGDVLAGMGESDPDDHATTKNWNARITRSAAGERAGGILRNALFDLPDTPTPWETHLRRMITSSVMPTTELTMCKPSRHMLAKFGYSKTVESPMKVPFEPGSQPKKGIKKIVVCIDTSGSITDDLLKRFCAEIQQIRNKAGAGIVIIACDAAVSKIIDIPRFKTLAQAMSEVNWELGGGGGTDFRPAIAEAEKVKGAACIVYLTDMMGPFPEKCSKPLIWASTHNVGTPPPCGRVIYLKDV